MQRLRKWERPRVECCVNVYPAGTCNMLILCQIGNGADAKQLVPCQLSVRCPCKRHRDNGGLRDPVNFIARFMWFKKTRIFNLIQVKIWKYMYSWLGHGVKKERGDVTWGSPFLGLEMKERVPRLVYKKIHAFNQDKIRFSHSFRGFIFQMP